MEVFVLRLSHGGTKEQIETESVKNLTKTEDINKRKANTQTNSIYEQITTKFIDYISTLVFSNPEDLSRA